MAADAYLKSAASNLQQAASAVKQTAEHIRTEAANFKQQAEHDLTTKQSELMVKKIEFERHKNEGNNGGAEHARADVNRLQREIDATKQTLAQHTSQAESATRVRESAQQGLASQASRLQAQAGDPALK